ncbi:MAG: hypothetical protein LBJ63_08270 [Prevotellaceae bacterium]|jgi:hypothetical protein|nr:hypothetical protein [Prevotellaceae bacterium]
MTLKANILFFIILIASMFSYLIFNPIQAQTAQEKQKKKPVQLYVKKDGDTERTALLSKEVFSLCPPLRPGRLKRRMKMLWGIDLADYPADGLIVLAGDLEEPKYYEEEGYGDELGSLVLAPKHGLIWMQTYQNSGMYGDQVPESFPPEKYALFYRYLMMSDTEALRQYYDKYKETFVSDVASVIDFMQATYNGALFDARKATLEYIDNTRVFLSGSKMSDLRLDAFQLYFVKEREKAEEFILKMMTILIIQIIILQSSLNIKTK